MYACTLFKEACFSDAQTIARQEKGKGSTRLRKITKHRGLASK
jgi:hypothetical protein